MKFGLISPFPPFRGGISQESQLLYDALTQNKDTVKVFSFKRQYPNILFPGKNQYVNNFKNNVDVSYCIDTINPFSWYKTAKLIIKNDLDIIIFRFWHPFFVPSYNYIKKYLKKYDKNIKIFCICDNVFPHERFFLDSILLKIFFKNIDGFFVMSSNVESQVKKINPYAKIKKIFLPIKHYLGNSVPKINALEKLNIKSKFVILFFGLIRDYKGLDVLLESLNIYRKKNKKFKLLIAGECYSNKAKFHKIIERYNLEKFVVWHDRYISDDEIKLYFSASDVLILPYKKASQSGVIPIAYHFNKIVLASNIKGLNDFVLDSETGYLFESSNPQSLASKLHHIYNNHDFEKSIDSIRKYKKNFSVDNLISEIKSFIK